MEPVNERFLMQQEQIEDPTDLRLMSLLREVVRDHGLREAARVLHLDHRTIANCISLGTLTPRVRQALERAIHLGMGSASQELVKRITTLEAQVEDIDERLEALSDVVEQGQAETKASLESVVKMARETARMVDKLQELGKTPPAPADVSETTPALLDGKDIPKQKAQWFPRRTYPQLVTIEPAEDDEYVYGEAWPAVQAWREVSTGHPVKGTTLTWMKRRERVLELEVRLLGEFQLTLPPDRHPIDKEWRRKQLRWHDDDLRSIRRRIVRRLMLRWVRRTLTLGLWRK